MDIWNIRGFGSKRNKQNLKNLICKFNPTIVCIQESLVAKLVDKELEFSWSQREAKAVFQAAAGHSGGIFTTWDADTYELINLESLENCLGVSLKGKSDGVIVNVFNIYAPQSSRSKKILWNNLARLNLATGGTNSIFVGDFNCTRFPGDRQGYIFDAKVSKHFNDWIDQSNLIELNISNARFTWVGPGSKRSRLDRAFINSVWASTAALAIG